MFGIVGYHIPVAGGAGVGVECADGSAGEAFEVGKGKRTANGDEVRRSKVRLAAQCGCLYGISCEELIVGLFGGFIHCAFNAAFHELPCSA